MEAFLIKENTDAFVSISGNAEEGKWNEKLIRNMQANLEIR
jgi:hypothetical protein